MNDELRSGTPSPFPQVRVPHRSPSGRHTLPDEDPDQTGPHGPQEATVDRALRIGLAMREIVGEPSVPLTKKKATGVFEVIENLATEVRTEVAGINVKLDSVIVTLGAAATTRERRTSFVSMFGEKLVGALIPMILVGVFAYLTGHLHWESRPSPVAPPQGLKP